MRSPTLESESPAPGPRGAFGVDQLAPVNPHDSRNHSPKQAQLAYFLGELRIFSLRLLLLKNEVDTMGVAVKDGFISADMAIKHLEEIGIALPLKCQPGNGEAV